MKRLFIIVPILLCLCSCKGGDIHPKLTEISFTAELTYYNETYVLEADMDKNATLSATIKEPETLKDLNLTVNSKGITAEYLGLKYNANEATLPFSKTVWDAYLPLCHIITSGAVADKSGVIEGQTENLKYSLTVSPTGLPQELNLKNKRLSVRFYNTEIKEE